MNIQCNRLLLNHLFYICLHLFTSYTSMEMLVILTGYYRNQSAYQYQKSSGMDSLSRLSLKQILLSFAKNQ